MTKFERENRRMISDTNFYLWRNRAKKLGVDPAEFDVIWAEAVATAGADGVEEVKTWVRVQEVAAYGL